MMLREELANAINFFLEKRKKRLRKAGRRSSTAEVVRQAGREEDAADQGRATAKMISDLTTYTDVDKSLSRRIQTTAEVCGVSTDRLFRQMAIYLYRRTTPSAAWHPLDTEEESLLLAERMLRRDLEAQGEPDEPENDEPEKLRRLREAMIEHDHSLRHFVRALRDYLGP